MAENDPKNQPGKPPGRPRSNRIEFFATNSFLRQNLKFKKLRRELKTSEKETWTIITSVFCYIAQNQALTPKIDDIEFLAEFCYWEKSPEILIQALQNSGFLDDNLEATTWFQNQPFAFKKYTDIKNYEKNKEQGLK